MAPAEGFNICISVCYVYTLTYIHIFLFKERKQSGMERELGPS